MPREVAEPIEVQPMRIHYKKCRAEVLINDGMNERDAWEQADKEWKKFWAKMGPHW